MTAFDLQTMGGLSLRDAEGNVLKLRTRKSLLLLAWLAAEPDRMWPRDRLAEFLWPGNAEEQARNSLRTALSDIRRVLGNGAVSVDGDGLAMAASILTSDVKRLRELAASDGVDDRYTLRDFLPGEFLDGFDADGEAMAWVSARRTEFRELAAVILANRIESLREQGDVESAIGRARDLLSLDPFREESHRLLMRLYSANGERSMAIAQFRTCRDILRRELGVDPSSETSALADEIAMPKASSATDPRQLAVHEVSEDVLGAPDRSSTGARSEAEPSIAVLPFTNMSGDAEQNFLADGIAEDILTDLSHIPGLSVAATGSAAIYRNTLLRPDEISAQLGVRYLLEGSLRRSGENIRITAKLVEGRTNRLLWAERYDRALVAIFELQSEIASSVVAALKLRFSGGAEAVIGARGTRNVEAHEHYLRGRAFLKEMTRSSVELSKRSFERAVELDPDYALAIAGLAESMTMLGFHYEIDETELEKAPGYCRKALALDPALAEAHCSIGRYHSIFLREKEAGASFLEAIRLKPALQEAHLYRGLMYMTLGRALEAYPSMRRAWELDDKDLHTGMMLMSCQKAVGKLDEGKATARKVFELAQDRINLNPYDDRAVYVGAMALHALGEVDEARRWANAAAAFEIDDTRTTYNIACLFGNLCDVDEVVRFLRKTLAAGVPPAKLQWMRYHDPDFDGMRGDPRFQAVFREPASLPKGS